MGCWCQENVLVAVFFLKTFLHYSIPHVLYHSQVLYHPIIFFSVGFSSPKKICRIILHTSWCLLKTYNQICAGYLLESGWNRQLFVFINLFSFSLKNKWVITTQKYILCTCTLVYCTSTTTLAVIRQHPSQNWIDYVRFDARVVVQLQYCIPEVFGHFLWMREQQSHSFYPSLKAVAECTLRCVTLVEVLFLFARVGG